MGFGDSSFSFLFFIFFFLLSVFSFRVSDSALVPAIYVFGDSLLDIGNNNHLKFSFIKANFPHNGVDFPNKKPTGRFSNGKNAADYLAEKLGLHSSPPYLSAVSKNTKTENTASFMAGVSFASGGAGIFNETNNYSFEEIQCVPLTQQIEYYSSVHQHLVEELGLSVVQAHLSKSLFVVVIGSNDMFAYFESSDLRLKITPRQYVDLMAFTLESQLKRLHRYGARKYVIIGVGLVGCVPSQRKIIRNGECNAEANHWAKQYNFGLKSLLYRLRIELPGFVYSYFDAYAVVSDYIKHPSSYGFVEIKAACCGLGELNADFPCLPFSYLCPNRTNHLFWDMYHPSQEVHRIFVDYMFDDLLKYTYPLNVNHLIAAGAAVAAV